MSRLISRVNWTGCSLKPKQGCYDTSAEDLPLGSPWECPSSCLTSQCPWRMRMSRAGAAQSPRVYGAVPRTRLCLTLYSLGWVSLHIWPAIPPQKSWPFTASCTPGNSLLLGRDSLLRTCQSSQGLCSQIKAKWHRMYIMFTRGAGTVLAKSGRAVQFS